MADCEHSKTFLASWHGSLKYKKLVSKIKLAPLWNTTVPISSGHSLWYQLLLIASSRVINESRSALEILKKKITDAQELLPKVELDFGLRVKISQVCGNLDVDGLRGDIVTNRAAKAHAAYYERKEVVIEDIEAIISLCLRHRLRKDPLESIDSGDKVKSIFEEIFK